MFNIVVCEAVKGTHLFIVPQETHDEDKQTEKQREKTTLVHTVRQQLVLRADSLSLSLRL